MTLDKIKKEALYLFATNGYEGTSLNNIAEKVGIRKPSLYGHIESKEQLFMLIIEELYLEYKQMFNNAFTTSKSFSVERKLFYIFKVLFEYLIEHKEKAMLWNRIIFFPPVTLKSDLEKTLIDLEKYFTPKLYEVIEEGIREGIFLVNQKDVIVRAYYCMTDGYIMHRMYSGYEDLDYELEGIWNFFWNGLRAKEEEGK